MVKGTTTQALFVLIFSWATGVTVNALRDDAIDLRRDYFKQVQQADVTQQETNDASPSAPDEGTPLEHEFQSLSLQDAFEYYSLADPLIVFIDARDDEAYSSGHIPGAIQFNYYHPDRYIDDVMAYTAGASTIIVYCGGGTCEDSILAARYLTTEIDSPLDLNSVYVFEGGMKAWQAASYDLSEGSDP